MQSFPISQARCLHIALVGWACLLLAACGGGGGGGGSPPVTTAPAPFTLTVASADLSVGQGQAARIEVSLQRSANFAEPVRITLGSPPTGIEADTLTLPSSQTRGWLPVRVSATATAGTAFTLTVVASATGATHSAATRLTVAAPQPEAQSLIAAALSAGTLDYGSSLVYRAYALLGDRRLPTAYRGAGSAEEDNALIDEIALRFASLPVATQNALRPFIVRPADVLSVWNTATAAPLADSRKTTQRVHALASVVTCPGAASGDWMSRRSSSHPVRVWARCLGEPVHDADNAVQISKTLAVLDKVYTPMTGLMGPPRLDMDGDDDAIDFYIVDDGSYVYRQEDNYRPLGYGTTYGSDAAAASSRSSSAFVTLPRSLLYTSRFHNTVIHEFFHVLQKAHNARFSVQPVAGQADTYESHWFVEASAAWASAHFDRTQAPWENGRGAYGDAHNRFVNYFQPSFLPLNATGGPHPYAAYIWPYFVEQETGSAAFMRQAWVALEGATAFADADRAIDGVYPFATHFKRFALKNLNSQFLPGDPLPRADRYVSLDPDQFVDDGKPPPFITGTLVGNQEFSHDFELKNLSARYVRLNVAAASPAVRKVTVDLSGLQPAGDLDVQALVLTDDGWLPAPLDLNGQPVFCFDKGPTTASVKGSFREVVLILSNHALAKGSDISGTLKVQPKPEPCATVWEGTIRQVARSDLGVGTITVTTVANVSFEFDPLAPAQAGELPFKLRSGSFSYDMQSIQSARNPPCRSMAQGAGAMPLTVYQPLVPSGTSANLSIFPELQQYGGGGLSVVSITTTDNCNDRNVDVVSVNPAAYVFWWSEQNVGSLSPDGNSIRRSYTSLDVSYDIQLDKKTEGD